jgi:hypothetical protein
MRIQHRLILTFRTFVVFFLICTNASALSFQKIGHQVEVSGSIEPGDTDRLATYLLTLHTDPDSWWRVISLNSSGGSLAEGLLLGQFLREKRISTLVRRNNICYSACALAFLGGTQANTADTDVGRYLEVGAKLGFHGFSSETEQIVLLKEAFDLARVINSLIIAYASQMQRINLELFAELLGVDPASIHIISTPKELNGLGITIKKSLPPRPDNWAFHACARHVSKVVPIRDWPIHERIPPDNSSTIATNGLQLRQMLLRDLYGGDDRIAETLSKLSTDDLISLALGSSPKFPIHRISVVRGAGFYYDYCYAYQPDSGPIRVSTLLVEGIGAGFKSKLEHGPLGWYPDNTPLWNP